MWWSQFLLMSVLCRASAHHFIGTVSSKWQQRQQVGDRLQDREAIRVHDHARWHWASTFSMGSTWQTSSTHGPGDEDFSTGWAIVDNSMRLEWLGPCWS